MDEQELLYEYKEITDILPQMFIEKILKMNTIGRSERKYKKIRVIHNRADWLWHDFIKIVMPFQMKTGRRGERKTSFLGSLYLMLMLIVFLFFYIFRIIKYVIYFAWAWVVIKAVLPYATALVKLILNKEYYKSMLGIGV